MPKLSELVGKTIKKVLVTSFEAGDSCQVGNLSLDFTDGSTWELIIRAYPQVISQFSKSDRDEDIEPEKEIVKPGKIT